MPGSVDDLFTADTGTGTSGGATLVLNVARPVAAGKKLVLATSRLDNTAQTATGLTSVVDSRGNTWTLNAAQSIRANTSQVQFSWCDIAVALQAGDIITVTWPQLVAKRLAAAFVCSGLLSGGPSVGSGTAVTANTNSGINGTGTAVTTSITTTTANCLVFGAVGSGTGNPFTAGSGYTIGSDVQTTSGAADRGLMVEYKTASAAGSVAVNSTMAASGGWAEAAVAFAAVPPPSSEKIMRGGVWVPATLSII